MKFHVSINHAKTICCSDENITFIIFNNNNNGQQTADLTFQNGGYYNDAGALQGIVTGVEAIRWQKTDATSNVWYDLQGRRITPKSPGIYLHNNKKIVIR